MRNKEKAIRVWEWLVEHPDKDKPDAYKALGFEDGPGDNHCPACDEAFDKSELDIDCAHCPLAKKWWRGSSLAGRETCLDNTYYGLWDVALFAHKVGGAALDLEEQARLAQLVLENIRKEWKDG